MKHVFFVMFFFNVMNSFAQVSGSIDTTDKYPVFIGVETGFNLTVSDSYDDKFLNEFLGVSFDFFFTQNHSIKTKIKYLKVEMLTETWDCFSGIYYSDHIASYYAEFIIVPVLYKWQFGNNRAKAYVQGGVYWGLETINEYQNYPEMYDEKFNDHGINFGAGTHFPLFENGLYFYSEIEIYKGFVSKNPCGSDYYFHVSFDKTITNLLFSLGFNYKFKKI